MDKQNEVRASTRARMSSIDSTSLSTLAAESIVEQFIRERPDDVAKLLKRKAESTDAHPMGKQVLCQLPTSMLVKYAKPDPPELRDSDYVIVHNGHDSGEDSECAIVRVSTLPELFRELLKVWYSDKQTRYNPCVRVDFDVEGIVLHELWELKQEKEKAKKEDEGEEDEGEDDDEEDEEEKKEKEEEEVQELANSLFESGELGALASDALPPKGVMTAPKMILTNWMM